MQRRRFVTLVLAVSAICLLDSCVSLPKTPPKAFGSELVASQGESEVVINSSSNVGTLSVYVDGELKQTMLPQDSIKLTLPNGQHTLLVSWVGKNGYGMDMPVSGEPLSIDAESKRYVYSVVLPVWLIGTKVKLTQVSASALSATSARKLTNSTTGIEGAIFRACEALIADLPPKTSVAVLSVASRDRDMATFVIDELEFQLVDSHQFKVVDRKTLDTLRDEQKFQLSGDVDDKSAVSIGKMLGANAVITGSITGNGSTQRLTIKALDVQTAQIITMAREQF
jgi:TolB-like protein